jgi:hypothetical protein
MKVEAEEEQPNTRSVVVKREAVTPQTQYKKLFSSISTSNVTKITKRTATIENGTSL